MVLDIADLFVSALRCQGGDGDIGLTYQAENYEIPEERKFQWKHSKNQRQDESYEVLVHMRLTSGSSEVHMDSRSVGSKVER